MAARSTIGVEVCYTSPYRQYCVNLQLAAGSTASMALESSGLVRKFPEIELQNCKLGVFGRFVKPDFVLSHGQRLEIYRPLAHDPKEARRVRAARNKPLGDVDC